MPERECSSRRNRVCRIHIVQQLLSKALRFVVPVHRRRFLRSTEPDRLELRNADLFDMDACLMVTKGVDAVFHAAGGVGAAGVGPLAQMELIRQGLILRPRSWKPRGATRSSECSCSAAVPSTPLHVTRFRSGRPGAEKSIPAILDMDG